MATIIPEDELKRRRDAIQKSKDVAEDSKLLDRLRIQKPKIFDELIIANLQKADANSKDPWAEISSLTAQVMYLELVIRQSYKFMKSAPAITPNSSTADLLAVKDQHEAVLKILESTGLPF